MKLQILVTSLALALVPTLSRADTVQIDIEGVVASNFFVPSHPLHGAVPGTPVFATMQVDTGDFVNSPSFPVRGYRLLAPTFNVQMGSSSVVLENPVPGNHAYFSLRNNDPAVDGFIVSSTVDFPTGVPTNYPNVRFTYLTSYPQSTLSSVDINGALGTYGFAGLSLFEFGLEAFGQTAMEFNYTKMTISAVPEPTLAGLIPLSGLFLRRTRRR